MFDEFSPIRLVLAAVLIVLVGSLVMLGIPLLVGWPLSVWLGLSLFETSILTMATLGGIVFAYNKLPFSILTAGLLFSFELLWVWGVGWLLSLFLPLTLFQAGWLVWGASTILGYMLFAGMEDMRQSLGREDGGELDEDEFPIPRERFTGGADEETGEILFCYMIANNIFLHIDRDAHVKRGMDDMQVQELSVRLADAAVRVLKKKPKRTRRFRVTAVSMSRELIAMGQRPYDTDILEIAVEAINEQLEIDDLLEQIVQSRLWQAHIFAVDGLESDDY